MKNKLILMISISHCSRENKMWNRLSSLPCSLSFTPNRTIAAQANACGRTESNLSLEIIQKLQPRHPARFICVLTLEEYVKTERISFSP